METLPDDIFVEIGRFILSSALYEFKNTDIDPGWESRKVHKDKIYAAYRIFHTTILRFAGICYAARAAITYLLSSEKAGFYSHKFKKRSEYCGADCWEIHSIFNMEKVLSLTSYNFEDFVSELTFIRFYFNSDYNRVNKFSCFQIEDSDFIYWRTKNCVFEIVDDEKHNKGCLNLKNTNINFKGDFVKGGKNYKILELTRLFINNILKCSYKNKEILYKVEEILSILDKENSS